MDKPTKKLEVFKKSDSENENTQEIVTVEKDSDISEDENDNIQTRIRALTNSSKFSIPMRETLASLMKSSNSSKREKDDSGRAKILSAPINTMGGDEMKMKDVVYDSKPEI